MRVYDDTKTLSINLIYQEFPLLRAKGSDSTLSLEFYVNGVSIPIIPGTIRVAWFGVRVEVASDYWIKNCFAFNNINIKPVISHPGDTFALGYLLWFLVFPMRSFFWLLRVYEILYGFFYARFMIHLKRLL